MFVRILLVGVLALVLWATFARSSNATGPERAYRVQPADTLWSIAVSQLHGDPREAIYRLQKRNHLQGTTIVPGQTLVLPGS